MIWKTIHLKEDFTQGDQFIPHFIEKQILPPADSHECFRIAVVGGGPKGMYAIDQLAEKIRETPLKAPIELLWLNRDEYFGCGPNYHIHQPDYLLINYCIGHVDAWMRSESRNSDERMNLMEWIRIFCRDGDKVQPTDFASRALVGYYLQFIATEIIRSSPPRVRLFLIAEEVKNIKQQTQNRFTIHTKAQHWAVDNILLATGHCYENIPLITNEAPLPPSYIPCAYPISNLDNIPSQSHVGIAGLGLTFIDVALHLTEGRGGKFDHERNYMPNGQEPILFPFSRNHLPILPRGPIYGKNTYRLHYINEDWIRKMTALHKKRKIDFYEEIYPILEKEIHFAYYSTLLQARRETEVEQYINSLNEEQKFGINDLLFPHIEKKESIQKSYIDYVECIIQEAQKGELQSPLMAAAAVWREVTPIIGKWYKACGFTGESQRKLDKELFGAFCRTSFGPPISNMKKILALLKSGIIQMAFEDQVEVLYEDNDAHFLLKSGETTLGVNTIIDARIARPNLGKNNSRFYNLLFQNHLLTPLENESYRPGCPHMDENGRSVINGQTLHLYFYGSNTEGFLLDNDSLSRTKNNLASQWLVNTMQQMQSIQDKISIDTDTPYGKYAN